MTTGLAFDVRSTNPYSRTKQQEIPPHRIRRPMSAPTPPHLAIVTAYFDFNASPWMAPNTHYCVAQWRAAGAYVVLVDVACTSQETGYTFAPQDGPTVRADATDPSALVADVVVGCRVSDVMWYKEAALNIALAHVPSECALVGWFDNDVVFSPTADAVHASDKHWWVDALTRTFAQNPFVHFVQPFGELALTTEHVRDALLGVRRTASTHNTDGLTEAPSTTDADAATVPSQECPGKEEATTATTTDTATSTDHPPPPSPTSPPIDLATAVTKCRTLARVRKSVMASGGQRHPTTGSVRGVTGTAWVARRSLITKLRFFEHAVVGGGDDLQLNLWLGATNRRTLPAVQNPQQHWYFGEGRDPQQAGLRRALQRYRKRLRALVPPPAKCAYLPCTLVHLYHGELATKQTAVERYGHLLHRGFRASVHLRPHPQHPELLAWADDFRDASLQKDLVQSLERSQSVREQTLLKLAKLQRCLREAHQNVRGVLQLQAGTAAREQGACQELAGAMRACLAAFDGVGG